MIERLLNLVYEPADSRLEAEGKSAFLHRPVGMALLAVLLSLWFAFAFAFLHPSSFETNDDPGIATIVYGVNGQYDSHLVFINILLGRAMVALLTLFPNVAWYTVFEFSVVVISFAVLIYLFFERFSPRGAMLPLFFLLFFYAFEYYSTLQFSREAGIASLAGLMLLFHGAEEAGRWCSILLGFLLTVVGSLYRFEVLEMLLLPLFGLGLYQLLPLLRSKNWRSAGRLVLVFFVTLVSCFSLYVYDLHAYERDPDWREYREFNSLRSELLDKGFPDYDENEELYESVGIYKKDLRMFACWDFDDTELFVTPTLKKLVEVKPGPTVNFITVKKLLIAVLNRIWNERFLLCLIPALGLFWLTRKKRAFFLLCYVFMSLFGILFFFMIIGRLGDDQIALLPRLDVTLTLTASVIILLYGYAPARMLKKWVSLALVAMTLLGSIWYVYHFRHSAYSEQAARERILFADVHEDQEHLYLFATVALDDLGNMWEVRALGSENNLDVLGGWKTRSPCRQYIFDNYGVQNPFRDVVDSPTVYFIAAPEWNLDLQLGYIKRHYEPNAQAQCVRMLANAYGVYRISSKSAIPDLSKLVDDPDKCVLELDDFGFSEDGVQLSGLLYARGENCFDTSLYMRVTTPRGVIKTYLLPQMRCEDGIERPEGNYLRFDVTLPRWEDGLQIDFYVETADAVYHTALDPALAPAA